MEQFNKNINLPYYIQIKKIIEKRIKKGFYPVETLLPSENTLSKEFDVTRGTIRNAIAELKKEGMVYTEKGKGTKVKQSKIEQSLLKFYSFGREYEDYSKAYSVIIDKKIIINPCLDIQEKLELKEENTVYKIIRLRYFNEIPLILECSYIPAALTPDILQEDLENKSIYNLLEYKYNMKIKKAKEYISPKMSEKDESTYLEIELGSPVFYTERITLSYDENPIELRRSIIRGDRFTFYTELY